MTVGRTLAIHVEVGGGRALMSRSAALQQVWLQIQRVAPTDVSVLVTGETGTGKELVTRLLHRLSPRAGRDLVALDCNAVAPSLLESELFGHERGAYTGADHKAPGVFELADGSTLFLDEIGNLPLVAQAKLLRVLQEREFRRLGGRHLIRSDFRLITATNADPAAGVRAGTFREDLYHRLKVVQIDLPPLRERREDIPLIVGHVINARRHRLNRPSVCRVSHAALDQLTAYDWPGNVRELENVVEYAILQCTGDTIEVSHLTFAAVPALRPTTTGTELELSFRDARQRALVAFERHYLLGLLRRFRGSARLTAQHARISTKHLRALVRRHHIDRRDFRPALRPRSAPARDALNR